MKKVIFQEREEYTKKLESENSDLKSKIIEQNKSVLFSIVY
jgi:hypothetical protein